MPTEYRPYRDDGYGPKNVVKYFVHDTESLTAEARFAADILVRWAMVQGQAGGEDSAGRAKIDLMPIGETVERACDIAALAFSEFKGRGWLMDIPTLDGLEAEMEEMENKRENGKGRRK